MIEPAYEYRATLMHRSNGLDPIYDGDTMWLRVDLGFGIFYDLGPCRLFGLDTPEIRGEEREDGLMVRDYVRDIMTRPENEYFLIQTEKDKKGKYGRYLVTIILPGDVNLNEDLIAKGFAEVATY